VGIEPTTFGLKGHCSTTELRPYIGPAILHYKRGENWMGTCAHVCADMWRAEKPANVKCLRQKSLGPTNLLQIRSEGTSYSRQLLINPFENFRTTTPLVCR
jgi:hypothetical protein